MKMALWMIASLERTYFKSKEEATGDKTNPENATSFFDLKQSVSK